MKVFAYANGDTNNTEFIKVREQLESIKPDKILIEKYNSGANTSKLNTLISQLNNGDKLVLFSLESTGRTARQLISLINHLTDRGVVIDLIQDGWTTSDQKGQVITEFAKKLVLLDSRLKSLATKNGLSKINKKPGRPEGTYNKQKATKTANLYSQGLAIAEIIESVGITKKTLYEYLQIKGVKLRSRRK